MSRFMLKDGMGVLFLPGVGKVRAGDVLEGEVYARFCPQFLKEIVDSPMMTEELPASNPIRLIDAPAAPLAVVLEQLPTAPILEAAIPVPVLVESTPVDAPAPKKKGGRKKKTAG